MLADKDKDLHFICVNLRYLRLKIFSWFSL